MWTLVVLCCAIATSHGRPGADHLFSTGFPAQASCRYNCGMHMGNCSCASSCRYNGNCCYDYSSECQSATPWPSRHTTAQPSCRYNCGRHLGSCSCYSSCRYYGECCYDYNYYCPTTTHYPHVTARPSCRYNCGRNMGSCSCSSSCRYYGNCCYDYHYECQSTTSWPVTARPSCRYNCGGHMGSCSCSSSCRYYGNCCYDYNYYCQTTTDYPHVTARPSCRYNCGGHMGSCSCSSSCRYYGNCCYDYYYECQSTTPWPSRPTTEKPCGGSLFGSGSFSSPNYPSYYYDNSYCVWSLRAPYDQRLHLAFTYLQLENCCSCDYISVYDGPSVSSRFLGKVCNNSLTSFDSSSDYLTVLFRTDSSVVGRGFKAEFMSALPTYHGNVACTSDNMTIEIDRYYLSSLGYQAHSLYLNNPNCRPYNAGSKVVFAFNVNACGTTKKFEGGTLVYGNTIRAYASSEGEITRTSHLKLNVGCRMERDSVAQIMYLVRHHQNSSIVGKGTFNTKMAFYTSSSFYYKVTQNPYEVSLNQYLYVQVDLGSSDHSLVLYLDTCVASPWSHDFQTRPYYLVRNGCRQDSSYYAYVSGTHPFARFRFRAFQFLRATESVYIQCKVLICQASDYSAPCRRTCSKRRARDLTGEHDSQTVVLGPIRLKEADKKEEGTVKEEKV